MNTCKPVAERLGLDSQICMSHALRRARSRLKKAEGRDWVKEWIWRLLKKLPPDVGMEIPRLERLVRDAEDKSLRRPRAELIGKRRALLRRRRRGDSPWTNNMTERAIVRSKTVRGYKSESGMLNGFGLTRRAWSGSDGLELSELVAA